MIFVALFLLGHPCSVVRWADTVPSEGKGIYDIGSFRVSLFAGPSISVRIFHYHSLTVGTLRETVLKVDRRSWIFFFNKRKLNLLLGANGGGGTEALCK